MHRETAELIAGQLASTYGMLAEARDAAGGMWEVAVATPFTAPDGRHVVMLYVGSTESGEVLMQYGDDAAGPYSDDPLTFTGMTDTHPAGHAALAAATLADRPLEGEWAAGMVRAYGMGEGE